MRLISSGCLIPKGWKVMPLFRNIHHNPEFFADPQNFDPTRFEVCTMLQPILYQILDYENVKTHFRTTNFKLNIFLKLMPKSFYLFIYSPC